MHKISRTLILMVFVLSASLMAEGIDQMGIEADNVQSISHYRVLAPPVIENQQLTTYVRSLVEDKNGYLWITGPDTQVSRYDGYHLTHFDIPDIRPAAGNMHLHTYIDLDQELWIGNSFLHKFDYETQSFASVDFHGSQYIRAIIDDGNDHLWLGGTDFSFVKYDKKAGKIVGESALQKFPFAPKHVYSLAYDQQQDVLWLSSTQGIYKYSVKDDILEHIPSQIDQYFTNFYTKDISIDIKKNALWVPTPKGLIRVNTNDNSTKIYTAGPDENDLPISYTTTTLLDSSGNLWVGLEKEGLCLFRYVHDNFVCLLPSDDKDNSIPFSTIEDIYEDRNGSLWLALNINGFARVTPSLEKFDNLRNRIKVPVNKYFKKSFNGIVRENGDIWIATDGGGIQIFNHLSGDFSILKHEPNNPNSLPSNSIITIAEDHEGHIWVGMWAGGLSKIDPNTMSFTHYRQDSTSLSGSSLAGDNVFHVEVDDSGGLWVSIWYHGVQYFNPKTRTFTNFVDKSDRKSIRNREVSDIKIYDNKAWLLGGFGLEYIDLDTKEVTFLFDLEHDFYTSIFVDSPDRFYIGSSHGFYIYNPLDLSLIHI